MPHKKMMDSITVSCFFVRYSERSRGLRFYCPSNKNIIETYNVRIIKIVGVNYIRISHLRKNILLYS